MRVSDASNVVVSATLNETVNSPLSVNINEKYAGVDQGMSDTFSGQVNGGTPSYNYSWYLQNTPIGYGITLTYLFGAIGSYNLSLKVSDAFGMAYKQTVNIIVSADPSAIILAQQNYTDVNLNYLARGSAQNGSGLYNFTWYVNGDFISYGFYFDYAFGTAGTYTLTLTVRDAYGVSSSTSETVYVHANPSIKVYIANNQTDVGVADAMNVSISGGTSPYSIYWTVDGLQVSNGVSLEYVFNKAGSYTLNVSVMDAFGLVSSYTSIIIVNPDISGGFNSVNSSVDIEMTDLFTPNLTGGSGHYSYAWYVNGNFVSNNTNLSYFFASAGTYRIKLVASDSLGQTATASYNLIVNNLPKALILSGANQTDVNNPVAYRGNAINGTAGYNYTWIAGGHIYYGQDVSVIFSGQGNYNVQLTVSDRYGRDNTTYLPVKVYADPVAKLIANQTAIVSLPDKLSLKISGGLAPYSIVWIFPSGQQEIGSSVSHVFSTSGARVFEVQITDGSGYATVQNFTITADLFVSISASQTVNYAPLNVSFVSDVLGGSQYTYDWNFGNGTSVSPDPVYEFLTGNYTVNLTVRSNSGAIGYASVQIDALPFPYTVSYSPDTNITVLTPVHYKVSFRYDATSHNVSWRFPNGQVIQGSNITYTFPVYNEFNSVIVSVGTFQKIITVIMTPALPVPVISGVGLSHVMTVGSILLLNGYNTTSPDASIYSYQWLINNETVSGGQVYAYLNHTGTYTITLYATDSLGAMASTSYQIQVYQPQTNSSIAITVNKASSGALIFYSIHVQSTAGVQAIEGSVDNRLISINLENESGDVYNYNLTINQGDYSAGIYTLNIVVFNNNSNSNQYNATFTVSQTYAKSSFDLIAFFGGSFNFMMLIVSVAGVGLSAYAIRSRNTENVYVGSGKKKILIGKYKDGRKKK